jgi:hypothetical protein
MKTIKSIAPILLLLLIIITGCCKKTSKPPTTDADGLPLATQTGANTFGCLIDGVPFTVSGQYSDWRYYGVEYIFGLDSVLSINIVSSEPRKTIHLTSKINGAIPGTFIANKYLVPTRSYANLGGGVIPGQGGYYVANDTLKSTITVTKYSGDRINGGKAGDGAIISGTFDLEMQNAQGAKIKITKGRFDIARK